MLKPILLALMFCLELVMLAALAVWGAQTGSSWLGKEVLAVGAPGVAAVLWGRYVSPRAVVPLSLGLRLLIQLSLFGVATLALMALGRPSWAELFAALVVGTLVLLQILR